MDTSTEQSSTDGPYGVAMETENEDLDITSTEQIRYHRTSDSSLESDQVYMGLMWHGGKLGMAYYDLEMTQVYMMLDSVETDEFTLLSRILRQIQPTCIIISSKQDERLVKTIKNLYPGNTDRTDNEQEENSDLVQFLPSIDFSLDVCKRRILNLDLPSLPKHYLESEKTLYLSSLVSFDNTSMIRATGGLLKYLEKMRVGIELEDAGVRVPVLDLKIFSLEDQVVLDETAFSSLQIFQKESHPSVYKCGQGSGAKEGLSLFGIMNRCKSQIGAKKLRIWFLRPSRNADVLNSRHEALSFFVNPRNIEVTSSLLDCLKHIKNISRVLSRMVQSQASIGDWQALYKTVYHGIYIGDICRTQSQNIEIFKKISQTFNEDLHRLAILISKIVDFDESTTQGRFVVKPNVDAELDERKRTYNGLPDFMTKVAREELNRLNEDITECNVIYLPQIGYLLAIPKMTELNDTENVEIPGLKFMFFSNNMLHYKSKSTRDLDEKFGDILCEITDLETGIMHKLQNTVLEHSKVLLDVVDLCAELDCLMSLASSAREFNYTRPTIVRDSVIEVKGGRHPLQEICCSPFVPNDIYNGQENSGKIKVLTGPNASGKSVYLKQVALIVYLAHIGSFVPAEQAAIGPVDRIFTRIKSFESVSVGLSTFMLDINQMSEALRNATEKSLVIVDEFGKGTEMVDGLALLCSCLMYWNAMEDMCPHIYVSTHFHSLIHQHLLPKSPLIKYMTMETIHDGDELLFLYQLIEGHTSSSYASHIAAQAGLPQEIVKRGTEVSDLIRQNKPIHRVDTAGTDIQLKRSSAIVNRFLELDLENDDLKLFLRDFVLPVSKGTVVICQDLRDCLTYLLIINFILDC